jgi:hypothetical protein
MTFECSFVAVARTKKQAKQKAAFRMLNRLKTSLADVLTLTVSEKGDVSSEKVCTIIGHFLLHICIMCHMLQFLSLSFHFWQLP